MRSRLAPRRSVPQPVVELLRLCVVVFGAALGYQVALLLDVESIGALDPLVIGVVLGSAVGYVLGGVLGRTTLTAVERTERALSDVSAEQIVAGVFGAVVGILGGRGHRLAGLPARSPGVRDPAVHVRARHHRAARLPRRLRPA